MSNVDPLEMDAETAVRVLECIRDKAVLRYQMGLRAGIEAERVIREAQEEIAALDKGMSALSARVRQ